MDQIGAKDIAMLLFSSSRRSKIELCICFKPFIIEAGADAIVMVFRGRRVGR